MGQRNPQLEIEHRLAYLKRAQATAQNSLDLVIQHNILLQRQLETLETELQDCRDAEQKLVTKLDRLNHHITILTDPRTYPKYYSQVGALTTMYYKIFSPPRPRATSWYIELCISHNADSGGGFIRRTQRQLTIRNDFNRITKDEWDLVCQEAFTEITTPPTLDILAATADYAQDVIG